MPKSVVLCVTNMSVSTNVPGSRRASTLSLAVSLPFLCCLLILSFPPASSACFLLF